MDGLECSVICLSQLTELGRLDAEYFSKENIHIESRLSYLHSSTIGNIATVVASAFYPAATQLYSIGDTPFIRCVDCISFPVITSSQEERFEKIPLSFALEQNGIHLLQKGDIVITKVGTPCFASVVDDYETVALSRTVLGLKNINNDINPYYLMVFLRSKYGFEQLMRQRELTIQYQLTLDRVKSIRIYLASDRLQEDISEIVKKSISYVKLANERYGDAEQLMLQEMSISIPVLATDNISIKSFSESFERTGRLDAEYYQPKYDAYKQHVLNYVGGYTTPGKEFELIKTKCTRELDEYPYVEIGDIDINTGSSNYNIVATEDLPANAKIMTKSGDLLISTVRPYRGAVSILTHNDLLVSGAFTVLREKGTYPAQTLQVLFRTSLYKDWFLKFDVGTSYPVIKDDDVLNIPIPVFRDSVHYQIKRFIQKSQLLLKKSKLFLEAAKQAVEMAIEKNEESAIKWLNERMSEIEEMA